MPSISKVFDIPEDYTLEQLKSSYISIIENLSKSDKSDIEKDLLSEQYKKLYKQGKQIYLERMTYDTELEPNEINLFDRFNDFGRFNPFEFSPYNNYYNQNQTKKFQDPFSKFDNIFGLITNNVDKINGNGNGNGNSNIKSQVYSYSSSYESKINQDGSRTIIESKSESKNGDKKNTINAYKKMSDGKIVPLNEDEIKQIENYHHIQNKNNNDNKKITNGN